jgi:signal peptidase II
LVFILDRATKVLIVRNFDLFENVRMTSFFSIIHVRNYGGVFSILHNSPYARYIFLILPILIAVVLVYILLRYSFPLTKMAALSLLIAGAFGNIYDRFAYGNVVDFLDFYWGGYHWPAFNVADIAVCVGIGLWLLAEFFQSKKKPS